MQINLVKLMAVVEAAKARAQAAGQAAWVRAIERAAEELASNPFVNLDGGHMLILSSTSQNIYDVNGTCQCLGYQYNKGICKHKAMKRLLERYAELEAKTERPGAAQRAMAGVRTVGKAVYCEQFSI